MVKRFKKWIFALFISVLFTIMLSGCTNDTGIVVREPWQQPIKYSTVYTVQPGDTLYSIAWGYGLDYRQVAQANSIAAPAYPIHVGQKLKISPHAAKASTNQAVSVEVPITEPETAPAAEPLPATPEPVSAPESEPAIATASIPPAKAATATIPASSEPVQVMSTSTVTKAGIAWTWPAKGKLIGCFSADSLHKGIDITGKSGAPIVAAAAGKVVYAGNGLRGYGELIIIKHNDAFLSAYAHNQKLLVTEGQMVRVGQVIARMGDTESKQIMLHFEIRKAGKPVNPLQYLPQS